MSSENDSYHRNNMTNVILKNDSCHIKKVKWTSFINLVANILQIL